MLLKILDIDNKDWGALIISSFALALGIYNTIEAKRSKQKERQSRFIDETIKINELTIANPELRKIYMQLSDPKSKPKNDEESEKLKSFCYKYLNVLDLLNIHYSISGKNENGISWAKEEMRKETYVGNWMNFYAKSFRPGTLGNQIMLKIMDANSLTGNYSSGFVKFVTYLLSGNKHEPLTIVNKGTEVCKSL